MSYRKAKTSSEYNENDKSPSSRLLVRSLSVLESIAASKTPVGINQASRMTNLNPATAFRIIHTLCKYGWLQQNSEGRYTIGVSAYTVGVQFDPNTDLIKVASYLMQGLSNKLDQTVNLMVQYGLTKCLLIHQARSTKTFNALSAEGSEIPMNITACGKVLLSGYSDTLLEMALNLFEYNKYTPNSIVSKNELLSQIKQVAKNGYAVDDQEAMWGTCCIAVPIYNELKEICAAISVTSVIDYKSNHLNYLKELQEVSCEITKKLAQYRLEKGSLTAYIDKDRYK